MYCAMLVHVSKISLCYNVLSSGISDDIIIYTVHICMDRWARHATYTLYVKQFFNVGRALQSINLCKNILRIQSQRHFNYDQLNESLWERAPAEKIWHIIVKHLYRFQQKSNTSKCPNSVLESKIHC